MDRSQRSSSPFSTKVSLVNPAILLGPGPSNPAPNIIEAANQDEDDIGVDPLEGSDSNPVNVTDIPFANLSVPPPGFVLPQPEPEIVPQKTAEEIAYEKKVAEFLMKNTKKDDLDAKIDKHLSNSPKPTRKRRTFTDYPVEDPTIKKIGENDLQLYFIFSRQVAVYSLYWMNLSVSKSSSCSKNI